jgi:hypothetical protein
MLKHLSRKQVRLRRCARQAVQAFPSVP